MVEKVEKYLKELCVLTSGDAVVAGVSGGADSVCLLCVLQEIYAGTGVTIHAAHVNHNLRAEAEADQKYVEELCSRRGVSCHCYSYDVKGYAAAHRISVEEAGRRLRYGAFDELRNRLAAEGRVKIAVAHTMDDNAETMLLNLFRGTGLKGLCGIPPGRGDIVRPLMCVRRAEIEAWLKARGIGWRNDCSNDTDDYTRNKIRHKILPVAEAGVNGGAVRNMNQTAGQLTLAEDYLADRTAQAWNTCVRQPEQAAGPYITDGAGARQGEGRGFLILDGPLLALHPYLRKRVLLEAMQRTAGTAKDIGAVHVEALEALFGLQCGKKLHLAYGLRAERTYEGVMIRAEGGRERLQAAQGAAAELKIPGRTEIPGYGIFETRVFRPEKQNFCEIPKDRYTKWFDYDKIKNTACFRTRREKDYISIDAEGNTQKLKAYMINQKIPAGVRDQLLLLADGGHIMWIVGCRSSHGYYVSETTEKILEVRCHRTDAAAKESSHE